MGTEKFFRMSSYGPESSSIEKFIISATFFIFIMSSYLSPIQSYNPFCDKIHAFNELLSHLPNVDVPDNYVYYMYLLNLPYIVFYCFGSNVGTCIVFSIYFSRLFEICMILVLDLFAICTVCRTCFGG